MGLISQSASATRLHKHQQKSFEASLEAFTNLSTTAEALRDLVKDQKSVIATLRVSVASSQPPEMKDSSTNTDYSVEAAEETISVPQNTICSDMGLIHIYFTV